MTFDASSRSRRSRPSDEPSRTPPPLDAAALDALAVRYVGRFATTRAKLGEYLRRKLRERARRSDQAVDASEGALGDTDIERVVARCVAAGYVDDDAFAQARAASLSRRGFGHRRVAAALGAAGIDRAVVEALAPDEGDALAAAERFARKRRIGRFGNGQVDRDARQRQFAAMLRAGHSSTIALGIINETAVADRETENEE